VILERDLKLKIYSSKIQLLETLSRSPCWRFGSCRRTLKICMFKKKIYCFSPQLILVSRNISKKKRQEEKEEEQINNNNRTRSIKKYITISFLKNNNN